MKKSKFTDAQIAFILRQTEEGTAIAEVCRKAHLVRAKLSSLRNKDERPGQARGWTEV